MLAGIEKNDMKTTSWFRRLAILALCAQATGACSAEGVGHIGAPGVPPGGGTDGAAPVQQPGSMPSCQGPTAGLRQLRLLSRREYRNTVRDLFSASAGSAAPATAGTGDCGTNTFIYSDSMGPSQITVHVAGDFNQWAPTIALGGWPLQFDAVKKVWSLQHALSAGVHAYKFVLNEKTWVADPGNPAQVSDGYGGRNSALTISCPGATTATSASPPSVSLADPTTTFPAESKPRKGGLSDLFPFDDAGLQVVSTTHIQEYWRAANAIAQGLGVRLDALVPCDVGGTVTACLEKFVRIFGERAFRRPLTNDEVRRYVTLANSSSDGGRKAVVRAMLSSPKFLYRPEGSQTAPGGLFRLTGYEVATALSYTFWGSTPDQALLDAAAAHQLDGAPGIEAQARRLLGDPRSRTTVGAFAGQWLGTDDVATVDKQAARFPAFTDDLRAAMADETRQFISHVVFEGSAHYQELLSADYSMVNQSLAALYGMAPVPPGGAFVKQSYADDHRAGLLGQASVLSVYSRSDQTSPIKRGLFVRRRLLCQDLPPPPPNVPSIPDVDASATTRERFRQHTADPSCASCHQFIDPVGFGFEHFDPIGRHRDTDSGQPVDSTADMNDVDRLSQNTHAPFSTLPELAKILVASEAAPACLATQYLRYARGAFEAPDTDCAWAGVQSQFRDSGYDIRELMVAATQAPDFVNRR